MRRGVAGYVAARRGEARQGKAGILNQHLVWLGMVRHGGASQGVARLGAARQGFQNTIRRGTARQGYAGLGSVGYGWARQGFYDWAHISQKGKGSDCIFARRATGARIFPRGTRAVYRAGGWCENSEKRTAVRDNQ